MNIDRLCVLCTESERVSLAFVHAYILSDLTVDFIKLAFRVRSSLLLIFLFIDAVAALQFLIVICYYDHWMFVAFVSLLMFRFHTHQQAFILSPPKNS